MNASPKSLLPLSENTNVRVVAVVGKRALWKRALTIMLCTAVCLAWGHAHGHTAAPTSPTVPPVTQHIPPQWVLPNAPENVAHHIKQWQKNGVRPEQAFELLNVMLWTQSPVCVTTQEAKQQAQLRHAATKQLWDIATARNAEYFLRNNNMERLQERNIVAMAENMNSESSFGAQWKDVWNYWDQLAQTRLDAPDQPATPFVSPQEQQKVQHNMASLAAEAGLASLRIPLGVWQDAKRVKQLEKDIRSANTTLQHITHFKGKVLGLHNRVHLTVVAPKNNSLTYYTQHNELAMSGVWEDMAHEWMHAFNAVVDPSFKQWSPQATPQGELKNLWSIVATHPGSWHKLREAEAQQWTEEGAKAAADYLNTPTEMLAYAWGSYVQSQIAPDNVFASTDPYRNMSDGVRGPLPQDAAKIHASWQSAWQNMSAIWEDLDAPKDHSVSPISMRRIAKQRFSSFVPSELRPTDLQP